LTNTHAKKRAFDLMVSAASPECRPFFFAR
jgi:hypothetical protein